MNFFTTVLLSATIIFAGNSFSNETLKSSKRSICGLGTCTSQCTSPDSLIGEQPLPSKPDINDGNYVDCMYACIDMKEIFGCSDGSQPPRLSGYGDNLHNGDKAKIPVFERGTFKAYAEEDFTPQDRSLLSEAFEIVFEQLGVLFLTDPLSSDFGRCTIPTSYEAFAMADLWGANFWDQNNYGYANIWRLPRIPDQRLIRDAPRIKYEVRVVKLWDPTALGKAVVGNHSIARPVISLNWNYMKGYARISNVKWRKEPRYASPGFWAGTIAHELLHTMGYIHPNSTNWSDPNEVAVYNNTFMVYFSDCLRKVAMPNTFDSDLTFGLHE